MLAITSFSNKNISGKNAVKTFIQNYRLQKYGVNNVNSIINL